MQAIRARSHTCAAASGLIGMCVALACAHAENTQPQDSRKPVPVGHAEPRLQPASSFSCGDPTGAGPAVAFRWPVRGKVTSRFGERGRKSHRGIDVSARRGTGVRAAAAGRVVFSDHKRDYGRVVILEHAGGYETVYAHNQENLVWDGTHVQQGQLIAEVGSTGNAKGPHLHFEVRIANRAIDPLSCLPIRTTRRP